MNAFYKKLLLLTALVASLGWTLPSRATAQSFSILHAFSGSVRVNSDGAFPEAAPLVSGDVLYGTTPDGGLGYGTVFTMNTDGSGFTNLHSFTQDEGGRTYAGLVLSGNALYGTSPEGGLGSGTVFKVNVDSSGFTNLHSFTEDEGRTFTELVLSNNTVYGATGGGTVFSLSTDGSGFTILHRVTGTDGEGPARLTLSSNTLYGTAGNGGLGAGTVFKINTDGTGFIVLHRFTALTGYPQEVSTNSDGAFPSPRLIVSGNAVYGTTSLGGSSGKGTIFKVNADGTEFTTLYNFTGTGHGDYSPRGLALSGNTFYGTVSGTLFAVKTDGMGFIPLHQFTNTYSDGGNPLGLVSSGSMLYGTASFGGNSYGGAIYRVKTDGTGFSVLHSFSNGRFINTDGADPNELILADNTLYGTTSLSGSSGSGTVFKVKTDGTGFATLHAFAAVLAKDPAHNTNSDGAFPSAGLVMSANTLYGTTSEGGDSGDGTVFKISTDGTGFSPLHIFSFSDGSHPKGVTLSGDTLFGTTILGADANEGTVFKVKTNGTGFTILHSFDCCSGPAGPNGGLALSGSTLYGTSGGGSYGHGTVFALSFDGSGFRTLYNFTGGAGGGEPLGALILSGDVLYGGTPGTIFKINTDGTGFVTLLDGIPNLRFLSLPAGNTLYGVGFYGGLPGPPGGETFAVNIDGRGFTSLLDYVAEINEGLYFYPTAGVVFSGNGLYGANSGAIFGVTFQPQVSITLSRTNITLAWPTNYAGFDYAGYRLQSTTDLISPAVWTDVSSGSVVIGGLNTVTNPMSGAQRFYRLNR